jgi:methylglutaconyl-CoA hydratase
VSDVGLRREGAVATLTLQRPERRNALNPWLLRALAKGVAEIEADPGIRVVVLAGEGPAFSAGADLDWMAASRDLSREENVAQATEMAEAFEALDACSKAVVARVQGPAIGGGAGLVACSDVAVASRSARFGFAEARLGLIAATISPYVLRRIGPGHARALFTSARTFDSRKALRLGLVHRVVEDDALDAAVAEEVEGFLACGPEAVAAAKRMIREASASFALPDLPERIAAARVSPEGQEGIASFLERRAPRWAPSDGS